MNKELLILRHGKSSWDTESDDFHRPLVERGKRSAELLGTWLQQQNLLPDFVISSPATRALDTAKRCCKAMGLGVRHIYQEQTIYEANVGTLKTLLTEFPKQAQRVLLVGHNPGLEYLLKDLTSQPIAESEDGKLLPTATLAHLALPEHWSQARSSCAELISLTRASSLIQQFPFVSLTGTELRERPAYYYTQVGVIPYQVENGELKLLLMSSDNEQKWSFPKGIIEPGLSAQTAAAKVAWKEAGLKGTIVDQALGSYKRDKWGGQCLVIVFPMRTIEIVNTDKWEKTGQQRQWVPFQEAMEKVSQPALVKMIKQMASVLVQ